MRMPRLDISLLFTLFVGLLVWTLVSPWILGLFSGFGGGAAPAAEA